MTFLYPSFLFALAALAIPVIIHLFNFRRARKIYFSSTKFLRSVRQSTSSKLRIKHLLILASRLLFLFFLVIAFAQPFIPGKEEMTQNNMAYIYLDNSMSMSDLADNNVTGLEAGIFHVRDILKTFPGNTGYILLTNDFDPFSNTPKSSEDVDRYLSQVNYSGQSRTIPEIYRRIKVNAPKDAPVNLYWISDFQSSTAGPEDEIKIDPLDHLYLVPVSFPNTGNIYVDSVYLDNPFLIAGEKNNLNIILHNGGRSEVRDVLLKLYVNGLQVANSSVNIPSGNSARISLDLNFPIGPINKCRISFSDSPVAFDNDFYFILAQSDHIDVAEIKSADKPTVVEKVFGNEKLFDLKSFKTGNIDYNQASSADLLVLNEPGPLNPSLMTLLQDFIRHDGTVLLIPDILPGNSDLVLPGLVLQASRDSVTAKKPLANPDLSNPFYSEIFESSAQKFTMPEAMAAYNLPDGDNLLKFRDGRIFLTRLGNLFILSCPLEIQFTDFQNNALFVPVMYRIAMAGKKTFNNLYYDLDHTTLTYHVDSLSTTAIVKLAGEKKEIIPTQHVNGNELILNVPKSELDAGFYDIRAEGLPPASVAFNYERRESRLDPIPAGELTREFGENSNVRVFNIKDINKFDEALKENFVGKSFWKYALMLAMFFLLAEILLIRFL